MRSFVLCALGLSLFATPPTANAQEWTRFHGPNGTGVSQASSIPIKWTDADYNWKVKLPGIGISSPVVWGSKVFLLSADPQDATRYVLCYSALDGLLVWRRGWVLPRCLSI